MSKPDATTLAVAYAYARLDVLRLKRERADCRCEQAQEADYATGEGGEPPCWVAFKNEAPDAQRLATDEMCEPCQRRQVLHAELRQALRVEASALGKLRRAAP